MTVNHITDNIKLGSFFKETDYDSDRGYLEKNLPNHLQTAINELLDGETNKSPYVDCLMDEVYGSINSAMVDSEITEEQARHLRKKYLGMS